MRWAEGPQVQRGQGLQLAVYRLQPVQAAISAFLWNVCVRAGQVPLKAHRTTPCRSDNVESHVDHRKAEDYTKEADDADDSLVY